MMEVQLREFLRSRPQACIVLVYDGALEVNMTALRGRTESQPQRLEILYTTPPETADDAVLEQSRRLTPKERKQTVVTVVTSDFKDIVRQLPKRVRHRRSEDFAIFVEEVLAGTSASEGPNEPDQELAEEEKPSDVSPEEVAEWTEAFSRPPDTRARERVRSPPPARPRDAEE